MNRKNVIRTLTVIAVVLLLGWSFFYFGDDTRSYKQVDTSVAMAQIRDGNVERPDRRPRTAGPARPEERQLRHVGLQQDHQQVPDRLRSQPVRRVAGQNAR
jgi:hypothetical protein